MVASLVVQMVVTKESSKAGLTVDSKVEWKECLRVGRSVVRSASGSVAS